MYNEHRVELDSNVESVNIISKCPNEYFPLNERYGTSVPAIYTMTFDTSAER